jgi:hypothetical protein
VTRTAGRATGATVGWATRAIATRLVAALGAAFANGALALRVRTLRSAPALPLRFALDARRGLDVSGDIPDQRGDGSG